jgi:hypothetical protein
MRKITIFLICFISIFVSSAVFAHSPLGDKLASICLDYFISGSSKPYSYNMEPLEVQEWNKEDVDGDYFKRGINSHFGQIQINLGACAFTDGSQKFDTLYVERSNNTLVFKYW